MNNPGTSSSKSFGHPGCHVCQGFGDLKNPRGRLFERTEKSCETIRYNYIYMHYPNIGALLKSAEAGCGMCIVICEAFRNREKAKFEVAAESSVSEYDTDVHSDNNSTATYDAEFAKPENLEPQNFEFSGSSRITIHYDYDEKTGPRGKTGLYILRLSTFYPGPPSFLMSRFWGSMCYFNSCCVCNAPGDGEVVGQSLTKSCTDDPLDPGLEHRPSRDLLSDAHTGLIQRWTATCKEKHDSCRIATGDQPLPSRVLVLSDPKDKKTRLIETGGKMQGIYACLSYCWGNQNIQSGQTNCANLSRQQQGIAFQDLPGTVVDAIHLCYNLGFQYLWVDRLCIIQDDKNDWSVPFFSCYSPPIFVLQNVAECIT